MNKAFIICARLGSKRVAGKALKKICGIPAINHIAKRLSKTGIPIIIACPPDDWMAFHNATRGLNVLIEPGNPDSPLHRTQDILKKYSDVKYFARVTHDDLLIDADTALQMFALAEQQLADYVYSPKILEGAGVEIIERNNLLNAAASRLENTEFISYFVKRGKIIEAIPRAAICRPYALSLDYEADATLLDIVFHAIGVDASVDEVCLFLDRNPHLLKINARPRYSFYTCVKNGAKFIGETIQSVLFSGIENFEYIIVDDGSTDNTLVEISRSLYDGRVRLIINDENRGLASSSNIALNACRGEYVMRIDADDILIRHAFADALPEMRRLIDEGHTIVYPAYYEQSGRDCVNMSPNEKHHAGCALMGKRAINELRFRDGLRHWDGLELYKRVKELSRVAYYATPTWVYRRHVDAMSVNNLAEREKIKEEILCVDKK